MHALISLGVLFLSVLGSQAQAEQKFYGPLVHTVPLIKEPRRIQPRQGALVTTDENPLFSQISNVTWNRIDDNWVEIHVTGIEGATGELVATKMHMQLKAPYPGAADDTAKVHQEIVRSLTHALWELNIVDKIRNSRTAEEQNVRLQEHRSQLLRFALINHASGDPEIQQVVRQVLRLVRIPRRDPSGKILPGRYTAEIQIHRDQIQPFVTVFLDDVIINDPIQLRQALGPYASQILRLEPQQQLAFQFAPPPKVVTEAMPRLIPRLAQPPTGLPLTK